MLNYIGYLMIATPFILFFAWLCKEDGVKVARNIFIAVAIVFMWLFLAIELIEVHNNMVVCND